MNNGSRAARLIRDYDWSSHRLGAPETWPAALRINLSTLLNSPESMFLGWGPELSFFFNDAYIPILGPRVPHAIGTPFSELWADAWGVVGPIAEKALKGEASRFEDMELTLARQGVPEQAWFTFSFSPLFDEMGAIAGMICVVNETTSRVAGEDKRHRLEGELRRLNVQLTTDVTTRTAERDRLWDASPDLLVILDFEGVLKSVNPAWSAILGYEPEELIGRHVNSLVHPDDVSLTDKALQDAAGGPLPVVENRYRHKDGSYRWISWVAAPDDRVIYATGRNVTDEKEAERTLHQAEEQLRQSQKVEAVGQLTGGVAHDFNNLLTVIRGSIDLLRRPDVPEDRRKRYIDAISDTTDRAAKLTSQLLAFARRQTLKPTVFDARKSILTIEEMLRSLTGSRIEIAIVAPDQPCLINADPSQFDTSLVNMAVNARDAMNGSGKLTIKVAVVSEMPQIRAHPSITGDFVAVSLTDTGNGIPPELISQIFEPFYTTKGVGQGTGLGLSQVYGFAKQSGGEVAVESIAGEGATFTLYLPRSSVGEPADTIEEDIGPGARGDGACVLIVEDNIEVGQFATDALKELGYDTRLAIDAQQALAVLSESDGRFDVVFSDVVMPGMSGIELGQTVRQLYPDLPVILASGYSTVLAQNGAHGFELLQKPYSVDELSRVLRKSAAWRDRVRLAHPYDQEKEEP